MAYGDYDGPNKPNKGHEGGACNRTRCQAEPAIWFNHGSNHWYCTDCADDIGGDIVNRLGWLKDFGHLGHPMFETRAMIGARTKPPTVDDLQGDYEPLIKAIHTCEASEALRQHFYELEKLVPQYTALAAEAEQFYQRVCGTLGLDTKPPFDLEEYQKSDRYQDILSGRIA